MGACARSVHLAGQLTPEAGGAQRTNVKVDQTPLGLSTPVSMSRHLEPAKGILLLPDLFGHGCGCGECADGRGSSGWDAVGRELPSELEVPVQTVLGMLAHACGRSESCTSEHLYQICVRRERGVRVSCLIV